jgi:hypothetical protein
LTPGGTGIMRKVWAHAGPLIRISPPTRIAGTQRQNLM